MNYESLCAIFNVPLEKRTCNFTLRSADLVLVLSDDMTIVEVNSVINQRLEFTGKRKGPYSIEPHPFLDGKLLVRVDTHPGPELNISCIHWNTGAWTRTWEASGTVIDFESNTRDVTKKDVERYLDNNHIHEGKVKSIHVLPGWFMTDSKLTYEVEVEMEDE